MSVTHFKNHLTKIMIKIFRKLGEKKERPQPDEEHL